MTSEDPVAGLIPWYASGTLDPAESAQVEAHLATCEACGDLLALARGFRRLAPHVALETLFDHVQSQRLVEFAENPAALEPDARRFITSHIQTCPTCAEALEILEDLGRAPAEGQPGPAPAPGPPRPPGRLRKAWMEIWRRMTMTVLRPVPALGYLAALVVLVVAIQSRPDAPLSPDALIGQAPPPARQSISVIPPTFELHGEVLMRGTGGHQPPASVPLREGGEVVPMALVSDIDRDDLEDSGAAFRVEIVQEGRVVLDARRRAADFDRQGRLTLLLDRNALRASIVCNVRITLVKPGEPRDGEELYRRSFVLLPEAGAPR